jgi:hypothetical protein
MILLLRYPANPVPKSRGARCLFNMQRSRYCTEYGIDNQLGLPRLLISPCECCLSPAAVAERSATHLAHRDRFLSRSTPSHDPGDSKRSTIFLAPEGGGRERGHMRHSMFCFSTSTVSHPCSTTSKNDLHARRAPMRTKHLQVVPVFGQAQPKRVMICFSLFPLAQF